MFHNTPPQRDTKPVSKRPLPVTEQHPRLSHLRLVPLEQIVPNPHQPRRIFDEAALQELADSIRQQGVLQPILLRQRGDNRFEIVAGERRFRASKLAGLTSIPAFVRRFSDRDQAEVSLIENLQREDLSPVETARAFRTLKQEFGFTQQEIAERVSKSKVTISRFLHLLELSNEMLDSLERREMQEGHARALLLVEDAVLRTNLWQQVVSERLSVRETEKRVRAELEGRIEPTAPPSGLCPQPGTVEQVEARRMLLAQMTEAALGEKLADKFLRHVSIQYTYGHGGCVEIGFHNPEDLIVLVDTLLNPLV